MRVIVGAVMAALAAACAQAQDTSQRSKDYNLEGAFNIGKTFGGAEALVQSCELAVVDPKIRQNVSQLS